MSFAPIIPFKERHAVEARRFLAYVTPHLTPPAPNPPPDAAAAFPPSDAAAQGAPAMPGGSPPPAAPPAPPPAPQNGFDPGASPPSDPAADAARFADYVAPHLSDNTPQATQGAQQPSFVGPAPPAPPMPSGGAPGENQPAFGAAGEQSTVGPDAGSPAEQAAAFASYVAPQLNAFNRLGRPEQLTAPAAPEPTSGPFAPDPVGRALGAGGDVLGGVLAGGPAAEQAQLDWYGQAARGERPTPEEAQRLANSLPFTAGPIAAVGKGITTRALGQPITATAAQEVARLRLDKFPAGVRDTIQAAAEDAGFWRTQRRGVIPDAQAETMADELGRTVDQIIGRGKVGASYSTEETRAIRNAVVAQSMTVNEIAQQIAADPTGAPPRLIAEQVAAGLKLADLTRVAEGARAEAGRTLRAYQAFTRDYAADPASAVQRIFRATNLTPEQATAKVAEFGRMTADGADPFQMANFWARVEKPPPSAVDWFSLLRYNAMLSGPRTLLVNTLGNVTEIPWRGLRDVGASVAKGRPEELVPEAIGVARGFQRGIGAALETLAHGVTSEQAVRGDLPRGISARLEPGLARTAALGLEAPMRAMEATDQLFRQTAIGMALGRQAAIKAGEEGLRGRALLARADELFAQPTPGMLATAGAIGDRMTYKGELGPIAGALQHLQAIPVLGNVALPFLRTIAHITNRGIDRSPFGIGTTLFDLARGGYKAGQIPAGMAPLGERLPDNAAGLVGAAALSYLAGLGYITGAGPQDPQIREMLRAQGWQPYALKIGDRWVGYQQFGPMAVPLSMAAAVAEARRYRKATDTATDVGLDVFRRSAQILVEQPYLQGIGAIYKGMTEPGRYGEKFVEQFLQTLVPYGAAVNTAGQALDPLERQPARGDLLGALEARLPGVRAGLPARQDSLGRPVPSAQSGLGALLPTKTTTAASDPTLTTLLAAGLQVPDPPTHVSAGLHATVPLTEAEQRDYRRIRGERLTERVGKLTGSASWAGLPAARQRLLLEAQVAAADELAAARVLHGIGAPEIRRRAAVPKPVSPGIPAP